MKEQQAHRYTKKELADLSLSQLMQLRRRNGKPVGSTPSLARQQYDTEAPLSFAQERLWFLDQLGLVGSAYNMAASFRLTGALDRHALQRTFDEVLRRHEILRTRFISAENGPVQLIDPPKPCELHYNDISDLPENGREGSALELVGDEADRAFDLSKDSLMRVSIIKLNEADHVLLIIVHHIACDGWSLGVLNREIGLLYAAYSAGLESPLAELPIQYADYAIWQRKAENTFEGQLDYWKNSLAGASPELKLPTDRARPAVATHSGGGLTFRVPLSLRSRLEVIAQEEGATLFMVCLAAFQILLSRYSGQEDILCGSGIAGRRNPQTDGLIGFFVNTLVLRGDLSGRPSFREVLRRVRAVTLGAYSHQDVPFEKLVKEVRPDRNLTRQPLFQVALAYQNVPNEDLHLRGISCSSFAVEQRRALFDLSMYIYEDREGLSCLLEYATDLFDADTIERMSEHFRKILDTVAQTPEMPIYDIDILTRGERDQIVVDFNPTSRGGTSNTLIHELFEAQASSTPDHVAVIHADEQMTYRALDHVANGIAEFLTSGGVQVNDRVCLYLERGAQMVAALLGILKAGAAYVPLDPAYPADRLSFILNDSAPAALLTAKQMTGRLPRTNAKIYFLEDAVEIPFAHAAENLRRNPTADSLAYVIYTSGSTGRPKGVMVSHRNLVASTLARWTVYDSLGRFLLLSPLAFDSSVAGIFGALTRSGTLVVATREMMRDPEQLADAVQQFQITSLLCIPSLYRALLGIAGSSQKFDSLRRVTVAGEACPTSLVAESYRRLPRVALYNEYGPTEGTVWATVAQCVPEQYQDIVPIGRPVDHTPTYILDRLQRPVPIGVAGEIHIGGRGVAGGYLNLPELTAQRFIPNPFDDSHDSRLYRTGDQGRWRSDGQIEFLGRNDEQVKLRGFRIELGEIEAHVRKLPEVADAAVLVREDVPGDKRLVGYVIPKPIERWSSDDRSNVASEMVGHWKEMYEQTYAKPTQGPSFLGWVSSYTGQPIPETEMEEWLQFTVDRIAALKPRRVLEIGCGVGLVLQHVAPQCEVYVGTDFSEAAIEQLKQWVDEQPQLQHVKLLARGATDLEDFPAASFDTVILNSVVQYFPDVDYLLAVLRGATRILKDGGAIFIGDVRHLSLLTAFQSAVQLQRAASNVLGSELRARVTRAVAEEKEMLVDPAFFHFLPGRLGGISSADVEIKRGRAGNELTRYRYDVVLHTGHSGPPNLSYEEFDWKNSIGSLDQLEIALRERRWTSVCLRSIPNARVTRELETMRIIAASGDREDAAILRRRLMEKTIDAVDPESIRELCESYGYETTITWAIGHPATVDMDVSLVDKSRMSQARSSAPSAGPEVSDESWRALANSPAQSLLRGQLIPKLRDHLKSSLPEHMLPATWVILGQFPLTPNGKVDRRALPPPQHRPEDRGRYVPPRNSVEQSLTDVWKEILRIDQVGIHDNFFELGGHSLLIVQMTERLRKIGLTAQVRDIYAVPTLADLAAVLTRGDSSAVSVPPNLIPAACTHINPKMLTLVNLAEGHIDVITRSVNGGAENIQDIYPLTPLQEGILFHHLITGSAGDTYARAMLFSAPSAEALNRLIYALQGVIDGHDILRTAVLWEHLPEAVQVVYRRAVLPVEAVELDPNKPALQQMMDEMKPERQFLDLRRAPLMVLRTAEDSQTGTWYALLRTHHLVCDNQSAEILLQDIVHHLSESNAPLPEFIPYREHVAQSLAIGRKLNAESFFASKLSDIDQPSAPFGILDVFEDGTGIEIANVDLDEGLATRVRLTARNSNVSPATLFHAAWALVVAVTTGRSDVVFGTVLLGRMLGEAGARRILGMFINTLPLRLRLHDQTAKQLVAQTQRELAELIDYEQASLAVAQRCSSIPGSAPLFTTLLNYRHGADNEAAVFADSGGLELLAMQGGTNYPLVLSVADREIGFSLEVESDRKIDPHRILEYVVEAIRALLDSIDADRGTPISAANLLSQDEITQVTRTFNGTTPNFPQPLVIHRRFEQMVRTSPDSIAVEVNEMSVTYADLNALANRLARRLTRDGSWRAAKVPVVMARSLEMIVCQLALLKVGAAYVPVDPNLPAERQAFIFRDCNACGVLGSGNAPEGLPENVQWMKYEALVQSMGESSIVDPTVDVDPSDPAYVMYTSGSTGQPKGVVVPHSAVTSLVVDASYVTIDSDDCVVHCSNPAFDASTFEIWAALLNGARLLVLSHDVVLNSEAFARELTSHRATVLFQTTTLFNQRVAEAPQTFANLRYVLFGGEAADTKAVQRLMQQGFPVRLLNMYGPTETTTFATCYEILEVPSDAKALPIGRPIQRAQVFILDTYLNPVAAEVVGEIYIGGAGVANGYLNRPRLTASQFVPHPFSESSHARLYKTGDLGRWRADGNVEFLGRRDQQIKLRGFRIELEEIQSQLLLHSAVEEAFVMLRKDFTNEQQLVAYVIPAKNRAEAGLEDLRKHLSARLPEHMIPAAFVELSQFPVNANGKIDRNALPSPGSSAYVRSVNYEPPQGPIEEILGEIWRAILPVQAIGRRDNFFELGGHSLHVMKLNVHITERLNVSLSLAAVFRNPTIEKMAELVSSSRSAAHGESPSEHIIPADEYRAPLAYSQLAHWQLYDLGRHPSFSLVASVTRIRGPVSVSALRESINAVVRRHHALRTRIVLDQGSPSQCIESEVEVPLVVDDVSELSGEAREIATKRLVEQKLLEPIDVTVGPVVKLWLIRLSAQEHVLVAAMEHIIADAFSMSILVRDLLTAHLQLLNGVPLSFPPLHMQFSEYAIGQQKMRSQWLSEHEEYWVTRLGDCRRLDFPGADKLTCVGQSGWGNIPVLIDLETKLRLQECCRVRGTTPVMAVFGAYIAAVANWCDTSDVVIQFQRDGRDDPRLHNTIGYLATKLFLRVEIRPEDDYLCLMRRIQDEYCNSLEHVDHSYLEAREPQLPCVHNTMFNWVPAQAPSHWSDSNAGDPVLTYESVPFEYLSLETLELDYEPSILLFDREDCIEGIIGFPARLYPRQTMEQFRSAFFNSLSTLLNNPTEAVLKRKAKVA